MKVICVEITSVFPCQTAPHYNLPSPVLRLPFSDFRLPSSDLRLPTPVFLLPSPDFNLISRPLYPLTSSQKTLPQPKKNYCIMNVRSLPL